MKSITMKDTRILEGRVFTAGLDYKVALVPPAKDDEILGWQADVLVRQGHADETASGKKAAGKAKADGT
jgi:hypothetical protein